MNRAAPPRPASSAQATLSQMMPFPRRPRLRRIEEAAPAAPAPGTGDTRRPARPTVPAAALRGDLRATTAASSQPNLDTAVVRLRADGCPDGS